MSVLAATAAVRPSTDGLPLRRIPLPDAVTRTAAPLSLGSMRNTVTMPVRKVAGWPSSVLTGGSFIPPRRVFRLFHNSGGCSASLWRRKRS